MDANNKGTVGVLLDFENLVTAALNDKFIVNPRERFRFIFSAIGAKLIEIAEQHGTLKRAYLAFSRPRSCGEQSEQEQREHIHITRDMVVGINDLFQESPYTIISVVSSHNSADHELVRAGLSLVEDEDISTIIIGSGDGQDPFDKLFASCMSNGKKIHVALYEKKPHILHGDVIPHTATFLVEEIRHVMEQGIAMVMPKNNNNGELSPLKAYKKILRSIARPVGGDACDKQSLQYRHVVRGLSMLRAASVSDKRYLVRRTSERVMAIFLVEELTKEDICIDMNNALALVRAFAFSGVISAESTLSVDDRSGVFGAAEWDCFVNNGGK